MPGDPHKLAAVVFDWAGTVVDFGSQRVADAWHGVHGRALTDGDVDRLYALFTPMNLAAVPRHAGLIEGVPALMQGLRARGLKIGSTTGYNREIMAVLAPLCARQGFEPDNLVCAGDVAENRPAPLGMYRCFLDLAVWPARRVVKVDDTVPGLLEGRHADCWTVAVVASGNEMGLTLAQWTALSRHDPTSSSTPWPICRRCWTRSRPAWRPADDRAID